MCTNCLEFPVRMPLGDSQINIVILLLPTFAACHDLAVFLDILGVEALTQLTCLIQHYAPERKDVAFFMTVV